MLWRGLDSSQAPVAYSERSCLSGKELCNSINLAMTKKVQSIVQEFLDGKEPCKSIRPTFSTRKAQFMLQKRFDDKDAFLVAGRSTWRRLALALRGSGPQAQGGHLLINI